MSFGSFGLYLCVLGVVGVSLPAAVLVTPSAVAACLSVWGLQVLALSCILLYSGVGILRRASARVEAGPL